MITRIVWFLVLNAGFACSFPDAEDALIGNVTLACDFEESSAPPLDPEEIAAPESDDRDPDYDEDQFGDRSSESA